MPKYHIHARYCDLNGDPQTFDVTVDKEDIGAAREQANRSLDRLNARKRDVTVTLVGGSVG